MTFLKEWHLFYFFYNNRRISLLMSYGVWKTIIPRFRRLLTSSANAGRNVCTWSRASWYLFVCEHWLRIFQFSPNRSPYLLIKIYSIIMPLLFLGNVVPFASQAPQPPPIPFFGSEGNPFQLNDFVSFLLSNVRPVPFSMWRNLNLWIIQCAEIVMR